MRRTTFTAAVALLTVMAGPPALAQAFFGIGGGGIVIGGPSGLSIGPGGISIVFDGNNNNAISVNALQQVTTNGSPSGLSIGPGGIAIGGPSGFSVGPGGIAIGGPSGFSVGHGGIAIGGPSGVVVESGITFGGAAEFEAVFGASPAAALGDAAPN